MPLTVTPLQGDVSLSVAVRFAGGPRRSFVVDTGSSQSVVSTGVARAESLAGTDLAQRQATVCSVITVPLVHSGPWSVPGVPLHPQLIGETDFGTISPERHRRACWARTSSSATAGSCSTTPGGGWCSGESARRAAGPWSGPPAMSCRSHKRDG